MSVYTWLQEIKLNLQVKLNYKHLTNEYLQKKRRKANEEIKHLQHFTHWPVAQAKQTQALHIMPSYQQNKNEFTSSETMLYCLPFYSNQRKLFWYKFPVDKKNIKVNNVSKFDRFKKQF